MPAHNFEEGWVQREESWGKIRAGGKEGGEGGREGRKEGGKYLIGNHSSIKHSILNSVITIKGNGA